MRAAAQLNFRGTMAGDRCSMGLVTDRPEWKPLLVELEDGRIPASAATIRQEQRWDEQARHLVPEPRIEIEIRDERTWAMGASEREEFERKLRVAVPRQWDGPDLHFIWARPVAVEWADAYLDTINKLWREWRRRRVTNDAFEAAREALSELHDRVWDQAEDHEPLLTRMAEILAEARHHPPEVEGLPPLPADQVAVGEVMDLLRLVAKGSARPEVIFPVHGWKHLYHGVGEFRVEGWSIKAFKRNFGLKYVQEARSPDGQIGTYETFRAREGNPFSLLEDHEQDAICEALEGL